MATYNGEKYVEGQISSILKQLKIHDELIISDGGSTDKTVSIITGILDSRIKVFTSTSKLGVIKNFENALSKSGGDYIVLSDQDDIWCEGKLDRLRKSFSLGNCLAITDAVVVNEDLDVIHSSLFELHKAGPGFIKNFVRNTFSGCCMGFSREVLSRSIPFSSLIPMHDVWIGLIATSIGKVEFIREPLVLYRRHDLAASTTANNSKNNILVKIMIRLKLALAILINMKNFVRGN